MGLIRNLISFVQLYRSSDELPAEQRRPAPVPDRRAGDDAFGGESAAQIKDRIRQLKGLDYLAIGVDRRACVGCGACTESCPAGAITLTEGPAIDAPVAQIEEENCAACGACIAVCPEQALRMINEPQMKEKPL